jgi:pilus assembly protein Flp/PilA
MSAPDHSQPKGRAMKYLVLTFLRNESGATAIEYGLIAALIAVVSIATMRTIGTKLNTKFTSVSGGLG